MAGIGEVWGHALNLPEDSQAWPNVRHCYVNVIDHVRLMFKWEEYKKNKHRVVWEKFLERWERAGDIGLSRILCADWHNTWHLKDPGNPNNYHMYTWLPTGSLRDAMAEVLEILKPTRKDALQAANEPYTKTSLGTDDYASRVYEYVRAANDVNFRGDFLAHQSREEFGNLHDAWEWHVKLNPDFPDALIVPWTHGLYEGKHRHPRVLHGITSVSALRGALESNAWAGRRKPKGWQHLVWHDEVSPVGKEVHINTPLGANMVSECAHFFGQKKVNMTFLTMDGYTENWGADGDSGWRMNTGLINKHGVLSLGCKALYDYKRVQYPDGDPVDPPGSGLQEIHKAQRDLGVAEKNWNTRPDVAVRHAERTIVHCQNAIGRA